MRLRSQFRTMRHCNLRHVAVVRLCWVSALAVLLSSVSTSVAAPSAGLYPEYHQKPSIQLIEDGRPRFIVVVRWGQASVANILLDYIERITGVSAGQTAGWPPRSVPSEELSEIPIFIGSAAQPEKWPPEVCQSMGAHGYATGRPGPGHRRAAPAPGTESLRRV